MLTLFDVDVPKRSEQRARLAKEFTDALMEVIDQPLLVLDSGLRVQATNERFARTLGIPTSAIVGQQLSDLDGEWNLNRLHERLSGFVDGRSSFERLQFELDGALRRRIWLTGRWLPWHESPDTHVLLLAMSAPDAPGSEAES